MKDETRKQILGLGNLTLYVLAGLALGLGFHVAVRLAVVWGMS